MKLLRGLETLLRALAENRVPLSSPSKSRADATRKLLQTLADKMQLEIDFEASTIQRMRMARDAARTLGLRAQSYRVGRSEAPLRGRERTAPQSRNACALPP